MSFSPPALLCSLLLASGVGRVVAAAPTVPDLVNEFNLANYQDVLTNHLYTHQGMNKGSGWGDQYLACRDSVVAQFQSLGYTPALDPFSYYGGVEGTVNGWNVVVVKPGVRNPSNEIYIVSGHYDSAGNGGADDDASGVAGVLEMARIFRHHYFARTIVFIAFDAEERIDVGTGTTQPGSAHYATQHHADTIKGMVSLDMIAHQPSGVHSNYAEIESRPEMDPIRNEVKIAVQTYGGGLGTYLPGEPGDSDHVAFMNAGFQACVLAEADWASNPSFHNQNDYFNYPGNLDWTYATKMARSAIGFFATKLEVVDVAPVFHSITAVSNGPPTIGFTGIPGFQYAVDLNTNLAAANWIALQTNSANAVDGNFSITDSPAVGRNCSFYRARFVSGN